MESFIQTPFLCLLHLLDRRQLATIYSIILTWKIQPILSWKVVQLSRSKLGEITVFLAIIKGKISLSLQTGMDMATIIGCPNCIYLGGKDLTVRVDLVT